MEKPHEKAESEFNKQSTEICIQNNKPDKFDGISYHSDLESLMDLIKPMPGCFSIPTFHFCWFSVNPSFGEISETTTKYNVFKRPWQTQFHFFLKTWLVCSQGFIKLKKKEKDVKDHTWQSKKDTDQLIEPL